MNALMAALLLAIAGQDDVPPTPPAPAQQPQPADSTPPAKPQPREVYGVHLAVDIPVIAVGGAAGLARVLFENKLVHKDCPCNPDGINRLDRWTVGYHTGREHRRRCHGLWRAVGAPPRRFFRPRVWARLGRRSGGVR